MDDRPELMVVVLAAAGLSLAGRQVALLSSSTATRATSGVCRSEMKRELLLSTVGRPIGGWDGGEGGEKRRGWEGGWKNEGYCWGGNDDDGWMEGGREGLRGKV